MVYLTVKEAAGRLNMSELFIRRAIKEEKIKAAKVSRFWRIPESEIERLLKDGFTFQKTGKSLTGDSRKRKQQEA